MAQIVKPTEIKPEKPKSSFIPSFSSFFFFIVIIFLCSCCSYQMEGNYHHQYYQQQHLYGSSLLNPSSSSYFTNPNPNSVLPSATAVAADAGILPPGTDGYVHPHHYVYPQDPHAAAAAAAAAAAPAPSAESYYYYGVGGDLVHQQYAPPPQPFSYATTVGAARTYTDLETKKQKVIQGGASADSVRVCTICNVVCNSDKVFASHVAGEKHVLKAKGRAPMAIKPKVPDHIKALYTMKKAVKKASKGLTTFAQSAVYCQVCKINCNSQEAFNSHKMGKKHMKNVQKLQVSVTPKPESAPENAVQKQPKTLPTKEDLESKKQKVLHGGAAVGAVRVCGLCNVVCNSESVFNSHIAGQKHIAKLNQQQAAPV
ncbi:zinc finger protein 346-like [Iris pallida]|uniref:Zinc finger protein 346-like n=1 Tax=Iris pallida TaxID=29817 RepID=A0AAX6H4A2_IRIPA|nr:zinc finger protein 346-like [Iris pallida]KAJ6835391.1 zinc finger protein 346-like [Iris pallida]